MVLSRFQKIFLVFEILMRISSEMLNLLSGNGTYVNFGY